MSILQSYLAQLIVFTLSSDSIFHYVRSTSDRPEIGFFHLS